MKDNEFININKNGWNKLIADGLAFSNTSLPEYGPFLERTEEKINLFANIIGSKVLDIGCAGGNSLLYLKEKGASEIWGLDISENQIKQAQEKFPEYKEVIDIRYEKKTITEDEYKELSEKTDKVYIKLDKKGLYKVESNNIVYFVLYIVVVLLYFGLFNWYTNGQTLGKKLMRLKIVNSKDSDKRVPIWSYIVRALVLYQPINYLVKLIGVIFMDYSMYYDTVKIISSVQGYLEMLILAMMVIRVDGRGLQDMLARTRVVSYDRNGNIIEDKLDMVAKRIADIKKDKKKKVIDEESSK